MRSTIFLFLTPVDQRIVIPRSAWAEKQVDGVKVPKLSTVPTNVRSGTETWGRIKKKEKEILKIARDEPSRVPVL